LESFLETDELVLAFGFRSAIILDPVKLMAVVFTAVGNIGAKAVVCRNWPKICNDILFPDHVFLADVVRRGWLLPRFKGFVHLGGAGHTAIGLENGLPTMIVPFSLDQKFWAARVQQLKLGPPPLYHHDVIAEKLAASERFVILQVPATLHGNCVPNRL
jgi:sterol 3beta-glucosyltransferase